MLQGLHVTKNSPHNFIPVKYHSRHQYSYSICPFSDISICLFHILPLSYCTQPVPCFLKCTIGIEGTNKTLCWLHYSICHSCHSKQIKLYPGRIIFEQSNLIDRIHVFRIHGHCPEYSFSGTHFTCFTRRDLQTQLGSRSLHVDRKY